MDEAARWLAETIELTRQSLEEARRSVLDLRATPLQGHNLVEALQALVEQVSDTIAGQFEVTGTYQALENRAELGLYRIAQEAINNIQKHTQCTTFQLQLRYEEAQVVLRIADTGSGFDIKENTKGFGLVGIRERVHLLHGKMTLESTPESGTRLEVRIPYRR